MHYYYQNEKNKKDGPHDLITVMRRIRSGKITPETLFYTNDDKLTAARNIDDFSSFFNHPTEDVRKELSSAHHISIKHIVKKGWQFTFEHQSITVFSGFTLMLVFMFSLLVHETTHSVAAAITSGWIVFALIQNCFFAFALRIYRGQIVDINFIEHSITPIMGKLIFSSVIFSIITALGIVLFIVPGVIAFIISAFIPFIVLDYDFKIKKTIATIITLLKKLDTSSLSKLIVTALLYLISVAMLFPIPLTMPVMAGILCSVYEDLSGK